MQCIHPRCQIKKLNNSFGRSLGESIEDLNGSLTSAHTSNQAQTTTHKTDKKYLTGNSYLKYFLSSAVWPHTVSLTVVNTLRENLIVSQASET